MLAKVPLATLVSDNIKKLDYRQGGVERLATFSAIKFEEIVSFSIIQSDGPPRKFLKDHLESSRVFP